MRNLTFQEQLQELVTAHQKGEAIIPIILEIGDDSRLDSAGGYPGVIDITSIPGYCLYASVDHDEAPSLEVYGPMAEILAARELEDFLDAHPGPIEEIADDDIEWLTWEAIPGAMSEETSEMPEFNQEDAS